MRKQGGGRAVTMQGMGGLSEHGKWFEGLKGLGAWWGKLVHMPDGGERTGLLRRGTRMSK